MQDIDLSCCRSASVWNSYNIAEAHLFQTREDRLSRKSVRGVSKSVFFLYPKAFASIGLLSYSIGRQVFVVTFISVQLLRTLYKGGCNDGSYNRIKVTNLLVMA